MNIHPEYERSHRSLIILGWVALVAGILGVALPILPGIALILVGVSLLSISSSQAHYYGARLRVKYPRLADDVRKMETWLINLLQIGTHTHAYITIPTETGEGLRGLLEVSKFQTGVAIFLHSVSGTVETPVSNVLAEAFRARGYTVLRFDAHNGLNEHGAHFTTFTATNFYTDLEHVLAWAKTQPWWQDPVTLVGHSIGGLVALLYVENHPDTTTRLVLLNPTLSGASYIAAFSTSDPEGFAQWQKTRLRTVQHPLSTESYGLSYGFVEDLMQYDYLENVLPLSGKATVLSGSRDVTSPPATVKTFAESAHATCITLEGVPHTPTTRTELHALQEALRKTTL